MSNVQNTKVIEDTHVIITDVTPEVQQQSSSVSSGFISNMLNPNLDIGIDFILNLNTESTSLVDVLITTNVEMPPSSVTTLPPPPIPFIIHQQQNSCFVTVTLLNVRSTLDDILKRIWMEYLPQIVWRNVDRERAGAMIQAIDRQLRNINYTNFYPTISLELVDIDKGERFYTSAGNPVKEILLKLNLPDTDDPNGFEGLLQQTRRNGKGHIRSPAFIANSFNDDT
ncbi:hypothetical protein Tco_1516631 [Tanacetum coccineum]